MWEGADVGGECSAAFCTGVRGSVREEWKEVCAVF